MSVVDLYCFVYCYGIAVSTIVDGFNLNIVKLYACVCVCVCVCVLYLMCKTKKVEVSDWMSNSKVDLGIGQLVSLFFIFCSMRKPENPIIKDFLFSIILEIAL